MLTERGVAVNSFVLDEILKKQAPRAVMCATFDQAFALYAEVEMIPRTGTRQLIQLFRDLSIDGVFVKSARTVLLLALDRGKPAILKMVHTKQCA